MKAPKLSEGFTVHAEWYDGRESYRTFSTMAAAEVEADETFKDPGCVRVEVRDNVSGLVKGHCRPVNIPSPERTDHFNLEYDIAPWAFDGD